MGLEDGDAVVVDSPIEMPTAEKPGTSPIESLIPAAPAESVVQTPIETIEPAVAAVEPDANAPAAADLVKALGEQIGMDLSRFGDNVEAAQAVHDMMVDRYASLGDGETGGGLFGAIKQPVEDEADDEPAPATAGIDLSKLDDSTIDPEVAAIIKTIAAENAGIKQQLAEQKKTEAAAAKQQQAAVFKQIEQRGEAHVSTLNPTMFGEPGKKRTVAQEVAKDIVMGVAGRLIAGMVRDGVKNVPKIETVVEWAVQRSGLAAAAKQAAAPAKPKPFTLEPKKPAGGAATAPVKLGRVSRDNDPFGIMNDPQVRAIWQSAMNGQTA